MFVLRHPYMQATKRPEVTRTLLEVLRLWRRYFGPAYTSGLPRAQNRLSLNVGCLRQYKETIEGVSLTADATGCTSGNAKTAE